MSVLDRHLDLLLEVAGPSTRTREGHRAYNLAVGALREDLARVVNLHAHYKVQLKRLHELHGRFEAEAALSPALREDWEKLHDDVRVLLTVAARTST